MKIDKLINTIPVLYWNLLICHFASSDSSNEIKEVQEPPVNDSIPQQDRNNSEGNPPITDIKIPYTISPLYLTSLAHTEQYVYKALLAYENQLLQRLELLKRLRTDYEESVFVALQQTGKEEQLDAWQRANLISSHPFLSHRMIRRLSTDFQAFTNHIWQSLEHELWEILEASRTGGGRNNFLWPSQEDLLASTISLIKLQETHDLNINQFANGAIRDLPVKVGLTGQQCLEINNVALQLGEINAAAEWFQAAHAKGVDNMDTSVTVDNLTPTWDRTYKAFLSLWPIQVFKTHDVFQEAKEMLQENFDRLKFNLTKEHIPITFKALCRGDQLLAAREITNLSCFEERTIYPYYFINPLKIEVFSWSPLVYQIHEFIGIQQLDGLSNIVVPSMVSLVETGQIALQAALPHTHSVIWDASSPVLSRLSKRIALLPGIDIFRLQGAPSDHYQISAFAVGNQYEPCNECFKTKQTEDESTNSSIGKVISTVHIVLHQPDHGGELAFPLLGVAIPPNLGSAIIYNEINLLGNVDERTIHGSCPVLIGEKWTATKLFHESLKDPVT